VPDRSQLWHFLVRLAAAVVPLALTALVAIAWANSHTLAVQARDLEALESEVAHLRQLVEQELTRK
jgi:hypothetical protein